MTTGTSMRAAGRHTPDAIGLAFPRLVRSEWIKLRSLRSTIWCFAILVVVTIATAVLPSFAIGGSGGGATTGREADQTLVLVATIGVRFTALVVAVLGVLIISGEYGTGQIRSTFTADPRRVGVLAAKALVLAVATFVTSAASTWIGVLLAVPVLAGNDVHPAVGDPSVFMPILGGSVYVTLVALLAFVVGLLVRASAGGIAITLGVLLVLPVIVSVIAGVTNAHWFADLYAFLPSEAGSQLYAFAAPASSGGGVVLDGWGGLGVLLGEVVVIGAIAVAAARRRDV